jgi:preprotein translocase subunit SecB
MKEVKEAAFKLSGYRFKEFHYIDTDNEAPLDISMVPHGVYVKEEKNFLLNLDFEATINGENESELVCSASLQALFKFNPASSEIPDFFYANSLAIVYPYLRAFISTLTTQAGGKKMILPIANLTDLVDDLKERTVVFDTTNDMPDSDAR